MQKKKAPEYESHLTDRELKAAGKILQFCIDNDRCGFNADREKGQIAIWLIDRIFNARDISFISDGQKWYSTKQSKLDEIFF